MSCPCRFIHYFPLLLFSCTYLPMSFPSILSSLILSFLLALPPSWSLQRGSLQLAVCSNVKLAALQLATFQTTNSIFWSTCNPQPCDLQPCSLPLGLHPTSFNLAALQPSNVNDVCECSGDNLLKTNWNELRLCGQGHT